VLVERFRALWARSLTFCSPAMFRGVTRYRSVEAAFEARQERTLERMAKTRQSLP